ncbi:MAG: tyrosine-type recombinase/integrase [Xanthobacteraceae bacterium]
MPLKLVSPRKGRSSRYTIRGAHLGVRINRSAGTGDKALARQVLRKIERDIERGAVSGRPRPTFASAALAYMRNGGESRFLEPILRHFKEALLDEIDQAAIDEAASVLYPSASPATRNRQVFTPISAVLRHAGVAGQLRRPKGSQGEARTNWIWPEQAERVFDAADAIDSEFAAFLIFLTYTGLRLSEALGLEWRDVNLGEGFAYVGRTKNGEPRSVHLPPIVVAALANNQGAASQRGRDESQCRCFRFRKNGHLYTLLRRVRERAGVRGISFHTFRHTYGTWMRRYGGLDTRGLVGTGAWLDLKSAARYAHVVVSEEAQKADLLPTPKRQ